MHIGGQADVHAIDIRVGQEGREFPVLLDGGEIHHLSLRPEISSHLRQIARQLLLVIGEYGRQLHSIHAAQGLHMGRPHEAQAKDRYPHPFTSTNYPV